MLDAPPGGPQLHATPEAQMPVKGRSGNSTLNFIHNGNLHGIVTLAVGFIFLSALGAQGIWFYGGLVCFFLLGRTIATVLMGGLGNAIGSLQNPSGDTTAYTQTFSHIEALIVRGALEDAAVEWEHELAKDPQNVSLRVRVADFHLRTKRDPAAAHAHYLKARQMGSAGNDLARYVQQKLVDLYLGPLADQGKAMAELRRLIDAHPGTREAEGARVALAELKAGRSAPPAP
jgi:hypothetical protein